MSSHKIIWILILSIIGLSLYRCKTEEIILHGEVRGLVIDSLTNKPIQTAVITLNPSLDTTFTGLDGTYFLKGITPGNYLIQASKKNYTKTGKSISVNSAKTSVINFNLNGIPFPEISDTCLNFEFDSIKQFTISNSGFGILQYYVTSNQKWIIPSILYGEVANNPDTITVTIDKVGLTQSIYKEWLRIISLSGEDILQNIIDVYFFGNSGILFNTILDYGLVKDIDGNNYRTINIGSQTWLAENLRTTKYNNGVPVPLVTDDTAWIKTTNSAYCWYNNDISNKNIFGALYNGYAVSNGNLCPIGWHEATYNDWETLKSSLGGPNDAGNALKEVGTKHWFNPNTGTNTCGFTAIPGGQRTANSGVFMDKDAEGIWWTNTWNSDVEGVIFKYVMTNSSGLLFQADAWPNYGYSVRCVKNH